MSCTHGTPAARAAVILIALFVAGCSSFALVNAASPNRYYERAESIAYGPAERQRLDVYRPDERPDSAPVVVFFYGGGWREGRRRDYEFVGSALSRAGFVTVIPDYRLYPEVRFPTFVEDGAAALAWVAENVAAHGGDRNAVHVMGHSAGAHIAAMLALNRRYVVAAGAPCLTIAGFVGLSGPYDFLPIKSGYLTDVFPPDVRAESQPVAFATKTAPTTLLIHGLDDSVVEPRNSRSLAAALEANGVEVTLKLYRGQGHQRIAAGLAPPLAFVSDSLKDSVEFLRAAASREETSDCEH